MSKFANFFQALRTGAGSAGGTGTTGVPWTATTDEGPNAGGIDCAGDLRIQGAATVYSGQTAQKILTSSGNANGQIAKARVYDEPLTGLTLSATQRIGIAPGRAGTVTQVPVGAFVKPTAAGSVTVQLCKNTDATPITAVFDLNSLTTNAVVQFLPITGNATFTATDLLYFKVIVGASLNSGDGMVASVEALHTDY